jgi:hypothetical protein
MDRSNFSPSCGRTDPDLPSQTLEDTEAALAIEQKDRSKPSLPDPNGHRGRSCLELKAIHQLCRHHKDRAAVWFAGMLVSFLLGGTFAIPASAASAWDTWMINWQANLILCFAGLCLVMSLGHSARLIFLAFSMIGKVSA